MSLVCLAITLTYMKSFYNFWQNCYWESTKSKGALFSHLTLLLFLTAWLNSETQKIASFHSNAVLLHCQASTSRWLNLFSRVTCNSCSCVWLPKSRSRWSSALDCCGAIAQEKGSWEFCSAAVELCWMQDAPVHCLAERQNCHQRCI